MTGVQTCALPILERQGGVEVVLGMERHVPHQPAHGSQGEGGAGVGESVVAVGAALIYATMGAPVFFHQQRVGRNGRIFEILKLRTMSNAPKAMRSSTATLANDPRITRLGRVLRASHIDELPQLWNILVGDMTLIGPRPEQPHLVARYREALPDYDLRHLVAPGLSGWSQVRFGYAADLNETRKKLQYDLDYLERFGPYIDLKIALLTCLVYLDPKYVR